MVITTLDQLYQAELSGSAVRAQIAKASITGLTIGQQGSYWQKGTLPAAGATPAAAATCNNNTLGGIPFANPPTGLISYLSRISLLTSTPGNVEVHDRLAHMGGLSGSTTTAQTVGIDLSTMTGDNMAARVGLTDYSQVQWFLEWYVASTLSAQSATIAYVNQSGTAKSTTVAVTASPVAGMLFPIIPLPGDNIRGVTSVTCGTTLTTAGSFGVTASREHTSLGMPEANKRYDANWEMICLTTFQNSSCISLVGDSASTTLGTLTGSVTLIQG